MHKRKVVLNYAKSTSNVVSFPYFQELRFQYMLNIFNMLNQNLLNLKFWCFGIFISMQ